VLDDGAEEEVGLELLGAGTLLLLPLFELLGVAL